MSADATFLFVVVGLAIAALLLDLARNTARTERTGYEAPLIFLLVLSGAALWRLLGQGSDIELVATLLAAGTALIGFWFNANAARRDLRLRAEAERREAQVLRDERKVDTLRAIQAEIRDHVGIYDGYDWAAAQARVSQEFVMDQSYVPYVVRRKRDMFLPKVLDRVELLDDTQIEKVVRFYTLVQTLDLLVEDLRSRDYRKLPPVRREAMLADLLLYEQRLLLYGLEALAALGSEDLAAQVAVNREALKRTEVELTARRKLAVSRTGQAPSGQAEED